MEPLDIIISEVEDFERQLSRRSFIKTVAFSFALSGLSLDRGDRDFLYDVSTTLIPKEALSATGIDVIANIEKLLQQGSPEHRKKVLRFISWSRRISFLYGGDKVAINARGSRFILIRKMGRALSSLCLIAFWADDRSLRLIKIPGK